MSRPVLSRSARHRPNERKLRVFAFDPGVSAKLDTISIGTLNLGITWEDDLKRGPIGDYVAVIDYDPASDCFYAPVDLNYGYLLAQDGLAPAEGLPEFHQQMVYAVAMNTIDHFERALGRVALWSDHIVRDEDGHIVEKKRKFVQQLRIYPHALREANAYYSPPKKALLFGYFPTPGRGPGQARGGMVFTCLSYDIVAHETTHALLDGLHPSFNESTNPDVAGLHEGFADIVALFQRFAHPEILEHVIAKTRGNLEQQNALGELAQQFGLALGLRGALRNALGKMNKETGRWEAHKPDPKILETATEAHERGGILLAAVFSAFISIYKSRSADLFRLATGGTGVLREGAIHPDLVRRLAQEAAAAANVVLTMCIRGLDYCPPVDVDFGTYLRGVVTADAEVYPADERSFRVAFIEAFRAWGIYPENVRSMSDLELRYPLLADEPTKHDKLVQKINEVMADSLFRNFGIPGKRPKGDLSDLNLDWDLTVDRRWVWDNMRYNAKIVRAWLDRYTKDQLLEFGLSLDPDAPATVYRGRDQSRRPSLEVHSVRLARRRGNRDSQVTDLVVEVRQRRRGYLDSRVQKEQDRGGSKLPPDFIFRRGCTLIIDPAAQKIRYAITTRGTIAEKEGLDRVRDFILRQSTAMENPFYASGVGVDSEGEHFAALHRHEAFVNEFLD